MFTLPLGCKDTGKPCGSSWHLDELKYCGLLCKLGQESEDRFNDSDKFQPCMTFITNPLTEVDVSVISEQMAELFSVSPIETDNNYNYGF